MGKLKHAGFGRLAGEGARGKEQSRAGLEWGLFVLRLVFFRAALPPGLEVFLPGTQQAWPPAFSQPRLLAAAFAWRSRTMLSDDQLSLGSCPPTSPHAFSQLSPDACHGLMGKEMGPFTLTRLPPPSVESGRRGQDNILLDPACRVGYRACGQ